ncbi:MAG: hypothetical protein ALAOOOJD_04537 [bacterium]|nr:hypothetical protein [bacterium]
MRKILAIVLIASFSLSTGCFTMKYAAPPQSNVTAAAEGTATSFKKSVKVWYALWGAVPISENSTAKLIADNNLKEVRVTTQFKFVDYVIGIFTGLVSIVPATMTVEGNQ